MLEKERKWANDEIGIMLISKTIINYQCHLTVFWLKKKCKIKNEIKKTYNIKFGCLWNYIFTNFLVFFFFSWGQFFVPKWLIISYDENIVYNQGVCVVNILVRKSEVWIHIFWAFESSHFPNIPDIIYIHSQQMIHFWNPHEGSTSLFYKEVWHTLFILPRLNESRLWIIYLGIWVHCLVFISLFYFIFFHFILFIYFLFFPYKK